MNTGSSLGQDDTVDDQPDGGAPDEVEEVGVDDHAERDRADAGEDARTPTGRPLPTSGCSTRRTSACTRAWWLNA